MKEDEAIVIIDFHVDIDESETADANGIPVKMGRAEILANMGEAVIDISVLLIMAKKDNMAKTRAQNEWRFMDFGVYGFLKQRTAIDLNVYFDLSAICTLFYQTPFQEQFCWITQQIGPDNLPFGSDFPQFFPKTNSDYPLCPPKFALEAVRNFGYPEDWIPKIIGENAAKLLDL